ncbi:hypothetical protein [Pseudalkalibacillus berkeleyi]|uniref:DUF4367 domain-containing protein n=1 Tax=Pseudalkalibacillus berkeleyi TaxID=1069813 RepID=A0ABS9GV24_9BACL|nr:hypothetical protein [Pseudalkalibacillus berkeleyi]MCF6136697.1 hypothetical protein [Pseudalkalibacillus berkeleyi]
MGKWTHAVVIMSIVGLVMFLVPENKLPNTLDVTSLKEVKAEDNETLLTRYEATSTKAAIEALPFDLALPKTLPFEAEPFKVKNIEDLNAKDGQEIHIELMTVPVQQKEKGWVILIADDQKQLKNDYGITEDIQISEAVEGEFKSNTSMKSSMIYWTLNSVHYAVHYKNEESPFSVSQHKDTLIDLANQVIEQSKDD